MLESIQKLYDEITLNLREFLKDNSTYNPTVYQDTPKEKEFPIVIIKLLPYTVDYTTKKYTDEMYHYGLEINIYSVQKENIARQTIANEITDHIERFFHEVYRMSVQVSKNAPNEDTNVTRNIVQATCLIDTKYKDKLVIYPS